jgi:AcrR family transcriptional regulator
MLRKSDTETIIIEKFLELMRQKSCFKIKVTELIKLANISRSSFYDYFDSIYDVIQSIEDNFILGGPNEKNISFSDNIIDFSEFVDILVNYIKKKVLS